MVERPVQPAAAPRSFEGAHLGEDRPSTRRLDVSWQRAWVPRTASALCLVLGLVNVTAIVSPYWHQRLTRVLDVLPGVVSNAEVVATAIMGVLLMFLSDGLARRKRRAWTLAVVLLSFSIVFRVVVHSQLHVRVVGLLLISLVLLIWLVIFHAEFYAVADPRTPWRVFGVFVVMFVVGTAAGYLVIETRARGIFASLPFGTKLADTWWGFIGLETTVDAGDGRDDDLVYFALLGIGLAIVAVLLYLLLRSPRPFPRLTADDQARMRLLLRDAGSGDSLSYFALRQDKSVIWSASGKSCIAYRVVSGVMLASGDPLGVPDAWPGAIAQFVAVARQHAWAPAVVGCSELAARVWRREAGLEALEIGDEAIVDVCDFSLDGRAMRNVRQMVNRTRRAGITVQIRRVRELPEKERQLLSRCADQWREGGAERGYSMALGRMGAVDDGDCMIVTAYQEDVLQGFLHLVPWGSDGLSLDLMRRSRDADPGINELLIVTVIEEAQDMGIVRVSLNFAVFRSSIERGERIGAAVPSRAWRAILLFASRWAQIESLYRFNSKFRPVWEPRFVLYPTTRDFARVMVAYLRAEGFLAMSGRRARSTAGQRRDAPVETVSERRER
ncbi:MAG TPA: phosphatidylglycerol lysyltransferase domain-containing protein [Candidatus Nanopelagicales bacterium]